MTRTEFINYPFAKGDSIFELEGPSKGFLRLIMSVNFEDGLFEVLGPKEQPIKLHYSAVGFHPCEPRPTALLICPHCGEDNEDLQEDSKEPYKEHCCEHCGVQFAYEEFITYERMYITSKIQQEY